MNNVSPDPDRARVSNQADRCQNVTGGKHEARGLTVIEESGHRAPDAVPIRRLEAGR